MSLFGDKSRDLMKVEAISLKTFHCTLQWPVIKSQKWPHHGGGNEQLHIRNLPAGITSEFLLLTEKEWELLEINTQNQGIIVLCTTLICKFLPRWEIETILFLCGERYWSEKTLCKIWFMGSCGLVTIFAIEKALLSLGEKWKF